MRTVALVPIKALTAAKSRLAVALDPAARAALTLRALGTVLAALDTLLDLADRPDVVVFAPDRDGTGTNALLRPPDALPFAVGASSLARHRARPRHPVDLDALDALLRRIRERSPLPLRSGGACCRRSTICVRSTSTG